YDWSASVSLALARKSKDELAENICKRDACAPDICKRDACAPVNICKRGRLRSSRDNSCHSVFQLKKIVDLFTRPWHDAPEVSRYDSLLVPRPCFTPQIIISTRQDR